MQEAAAPGPAMGGFAAATGTFHHSVRGAAVSIDFARPCKQLIVDWPLMIIRPVRSSHKAVSRAHTDEINQADNLEAGRTRKVIRIIWVLIRDQVS